MPIVILLDVSLSMSRPINQELGRNVTRASLAAAGINSMLDHLAANSRLEFVSLIVFSSLYEVICGFTRDYDAIRQKIRMLEDFDKTCLEAALLGAYHVILTEWGHQTHTHIVLVTDGSVSTSIGPSPTLPPVAFPCSLHVICLAPPNDPSLAISTPVYRRLIDHSSGYSGSAPGMLYIPEQVLSLSSINALFRRLCNEQLAPWRGVIRCGALEARVTLTPAPIPITHTTDFDSVRLTMTNNLEICGFIAMQDIGSPMALNRHLVLPVAPLTTPQAPKTPTPGKGDSSEPPSTPEEDPSDTAKLANFCVLLHGALKVENVAGLVQLGEDWYGFVHSWADSKKKSNLMLSVLPPGDEAVPWLGPLSQLGTIDMSEQGEVFPIRVSERRSYSSTSGSGSAGTGTAWVNPGGLQTDLHKLLRHARKLPDKIHHFYKEVNRVRRAALALGWVEALEAAATLLEREISVLPPGASLPLTMAAHHLRNTTDPKSQLPLN